MFFREKFIQVQKTLDERIRDPGLQNILLMRPLVFPVCGNPVAAEDRIGFVQTEQRAGGNADHELFFNVVSHRLPVLLLCSTKFDIFI